MSCIHKTDCERCEYQQQDNGPPFSRCQRLSNWATQYIQKQKEATEQALGPRTLKNVSIVKQKGWTEWGTFGKFLINPKKWMSRDNPYVTEMWSPDFFLKTKSDLSTMKYSTFRLLESLVAIFSEISMSKSLCENGKGMLINTAIFAKETLCFSAMLIQSALNYIINIDGLNFLKGTMGVMYSTLHLTGTSVLAIGHLLAGIITCDLEQFKELKTDLINIGYDVLSLAACVGHAIPSWAPLALAAAFPHVALALAIAKIGKKTLGLPDILGYGSTLLLLKLEILRTPPGEKRDELQERYSHMMSELNPGKSMEGKVITAAATHMVGEATESVVSLFAGEATAKIAKYTIYGLGAGAVAIAQGQALREKSQKDQKGTPKTTVDLREAG